MKIPVKNFTYYIYQHVSLYEWFRHAFAGDGNEKEDGKLFLKLSNFEPSKYAQSIGNSIKHKSRFFQLDQRLLEHILQQFEVFDVISPSARNIKSPMPSKITSSQPYNSIDTHRRCAGRQVSIRSAWALPRPMAPVCAGDTGIGARCAPGATGRRPGAPGPSGAERHVSAAVRWTSQEW